MKNQLIFLVLIIAGLYSCEKENIEGKIKNDPTLAAELKSSPENIVIGENNLFLTTYLWRDFMPNSEENGSPLICINYLTDQDSTDIVSSISLKKQYVVKGNEIWAENYSEIENTPEFVLKGVVRNGPKWGPDITVDVICEFENQGQIFRILANSQMIKATY
jgi:hypothetical protein